MHGVGAKDDGSAVEREIRELVDEVRLRALHLARSANDPRVEAAIIEGLRQALKDCVVRDPWY